MLSGPSLLKSHQWYHIADITLVISVVAALTSQWEAMPHILEVWILLIYLREKYLGQLCCKLTIQVSFGLCSLDIFHLHGEQPQYMVISEGLGKDLFTNTWWCLERVSEAQLRACK